MLATADTGKSLRVGEQRLGGADFCPGAQFISRVNRFASAPVGLSVAIRESRIAFAPSVCKREGFVKDEPSICRRDKAGC